MSNCSGNGNGHGGNLDADGDGRVPAAWIYNRLSRWLGYARERPPLEPARPRPRTPRPRATPQVQRPQLTPLTPAPRPARHAHPQRGERPRRTSLSARQLDRRPPLSPPRSPAAGWPATSPRDGRTCSRFSARGVSTSTPPGNATSPLYTGTSRSSPTAIFSLRSTTSPGPPRRGRPTPSTPASSPLKPSGTAARRAGQGEQVTTRPRPEGRGKRRAGAR
jgi:hypothetical protein